MSTVFYYLTFPFVRYALFAGVLIALCASLLGVTLVLRRYSMIGDGLSHVAFGAMAVAAVIGFTNDFLITLPLTVIAAVILLKSDEKTRVKGDAAVAMISVGALAVGYLLMNITGSGANLSGDVCSTLFGATTVLTLAPRDVWICVILSAIVVFIYVFLCNRIFSVTFDEPFARATGLPTRAYNTLLAVISAVVIVLAMKLVGALLISALIIFPPLAAMAFCKSFKTTLLWSGIIGVACAFLGMVASILWSLPVGSSIVVVNMAVFFLCRIFGRK